MRQIWKYNKKIMIYIRSVKLWCTIYKGTRLTAALYGFTSTKRRHKTVIKLYNYTLLDSSLGRVKKKKNSLQQ